MSTDSIVGHWTKGPVKLYGVWLIHTTGWTRSGGGGGSDEQGREETILEGLGTGSECIHYFHYLLLLGCRPLLTLYLITPEHLLFHFLLRGHVSLV